MLPLSARMGRTGCPNSDKLSIERKIMMGKGRVLFLAILLAGAITAAAPLSTRTWAQGSSATPAEQGPVADAQIPPYILAAVNSPDRPAADKALDAGRKPAQILTFFGVKPGMRVADISAMGGWTTELLSLVVGPNGKVYSQNGKNLPA